MELTDETLADIHKCVDMGLDDIRENGGEYRKMGFYGLYEFLYNLIIQVFPECPEVVIFKRVQEWYIKYEETEVDFVADKSLQVEYLKTIPLPKQRTPEWFQFRLDRITASDLASVLNIGHYARPFEVLERKVTGNMTYSPNKYTIHGTKFEDVACHAYELRTGRHITEFGCLPHPKYEMLGASPDGISDEGVMLEIKCPYSRKIKGFPPIYYWTQMQLQLEVADLEVCDFLEVEIREYPTQIEYVQDAVEGKTTSRSHGLERGIVIELLLEDGKSEYLYPPFDVGMNEQLAAANKMINEVVDSGREDITSINQTYFYFTVYSCIRIYRDRSWFKSILPDVYEFWSNVLHWREAGIENNPEYIARETRKQNRKPKSPKVSREMKMIDDITGGKCPF